jgi:hypothetical protein
VRENKNAHMILVGKTTLKKTLGGLKLKRKDIIKIGSQDGG